MDKKNNSIFEYIYWRGDISFKQENINNIDSLILSEIAYLDFDNLEIEGKTIYEINKLYFENNETDTENKKFSFNSKSLDIFKAIAVKKRFKDIVLYNYIDIVDKEKCMQFSAITFKLTNNLFYVAFRGTDDTLLGWKEDLNMTYLDVIPSQYTGAAYLSYTYDKYIKSKNIFSKNRMIVGGHSKGGNIAIFSVMKNHSKLIKSVIKIDNFDGPGFEEKTINSKEYRNIKNKITNFLPTGSVFGMLLNHNSKIKYVQTSINTMMQHSGLYWLVDINDFLYEDDLEHTNKVLSTTLQSMLDSLTKEERREFIDQFFDALEGAGLFTIGDLSENKLNALITSAVSIKNMNEKYRSIAINLLTIIVKMNTDIKINIPNPLSKKNKKST